MCSSDLIARQPTQAELPDAAEGEPLLSKHVVKQLQAALTSATDVIVDTGDSWRAFLVLELLIARLTGGCALYPCVRASDRPTFCDQKMERLLAGSWGRGCGSPRAPRTRCRCCTAP